MDPFIDCHSSKVHLILECLSSRPVIIRMSKRFRNRIRRDFRRVLPPLPLLTAVLAAAAFYCAYPHFFTTSDPQTTPIHVPEMADAVSVRIATNAALNEVVGRYDGFKKDYAVDMANGIVLYHEGENLFSPSYQSRIESCVAEVGFKAKAYWWKC